MNKNQLLPLGGTLLLIALLAAVWMFRLKNASSPGVPEVTVLPSGAAKVPAPTEPTHENPDSSGSHPRPAASDQPITRDPFVLPDALKETLRQKEAAKEEERRRKAIQPPAPSVPAQPPNLRLQGILWGTARPQAIINRKIVSVGDAVENAQIVSVSRDGVMVSFNGQQYQLKLATRGSARGASSE